MLDDSTDPILSNIRRVGLFNSRNDRVKVDKTLSTMSGVIRSLSMVIYIKKVKLKWREIYCDYTVGL